MKINNILLILGAGLTIFAFQQCTAPTKSNSEIIVGKWAMDSVIQRGNNVTSEHDPNDERWIEFKADGSFQSDGRPYGPNSGHWNIDSTGVLHLLSSQPDDDSDWNIELSEHDMSWRGLGDPGKEAFKIVFSKEN